MADFTMGNGTFYRNGVNFGECDVLLTHSRESDVLTSHFIGETSGLRLYESPCTSVIIISDHDLHQLYLIWFNSFLLSSIPATSLLQFSLRIALIFRRDAFVRETNYSSPKFPFLSLSLVRQRKLICERTFRSLVRRFDQARVQQNTTFKFVNHQWT